MHIQNSTLQFQAWHRAETQERVVLRVEHRPRDAEPSVAAGGASPLEEVVDDGRLDPKLEPLVRMIEWLTGRPVRVFDAREFAPASGGAAATEASTTRITALRQYRETESSVVDVQGELLTSDGERIAFSLRLELDREYREFTAQVNGGANGTRKDPLVINLDVGSAALTSQRFRFDLDADGRDDSLPGLVRGSGFLVLDRNNNGRVDDGRELFGAQSGDGFADLAGFDVDGNGWIDAADPVFERLQWWNPQQGLVRLADTGVAAISTARIASPFALRGEGNADLGALRSTGVYVTDDRRVGTVQQIDLTV